MSSALVYIFMVILLGYLLIKIFLGNALNPLMAAGASFGLGLGVNSFVFFLLSIVGIHLTGAIIAFYLGLLIAFLLVVILKNNISFHKEREAIGRLQEFLKDPIADILFIASLVFIVTVFYTTLKTGFRNSDEWSYWGVATKRIFQTGSVFLKGMGFEGFEKYPLMLPISAASINLFYGQFMENISKLISPFSLVFTVIFVGGYLAKLKFRQREILVFLLFILTAGHEVTKMASSLYADWLFAYLYTMGVILYLVGRSAKKSKGPLLVFAGLFLSLAAWAKIEGSIICVATSMCLVLGSSIFENERVSNLLKEARVFIPATLFFPLTWYLFTSTQHFVQAGWTTKLMSDPISSVKNIGVILERMFKKTVSRNNYSLFWGWVAVAASVSVVFLRKRANLVLLMGIMVLNVSYLLSSYLFVFGPAEGMFAASFERYILHFLPLAVVFVALVYGELVNWYVGDREIG